MKILGQTHGRGDEDEDEEKSVSQKKKWSVPRCSSSSSCLREVAWLAMEGLRSGFATLRKEIRPLLSTPRRPRTSPVSTTTISTRRATTPRAVSGSGFVCYSSMFEWEKKYETPDWAAKLATPEHGRVRLGLFPTPIHKWALPRLPPNVEVYIKRDDLSGMQLSGNKVRKLEFLLAEAKAKEYDSVITIGGIQSNHCRATSVASRYLGLDCFLILRNSRAAVDSDPGLVGNLLVERLVGASVEQVTKEEYTRVGSVELCRQLQEKLKKSGRNPYIIPVGGSNALGSWGYLQFVEELSKQADQASGPFTDIVMACGSGGTTAGIGLGCHLAKTGTKVHAYGVCDDPKYFYDYCQEILDGMGATAEVVGATSRDLFTAIQAKGSGYAISTEEELAFVKEVAETTGVILDPVYSGKALYQFMQDVAREPSAWANKKVLFLHTGGLLGMYDKTDQLLKLMDASKASRMEVVPS